MPLKCVRVLWILILTQGMAWSASAEETRPGFYNAEVDDSKPILRVTFINNKASTDNSLTQNRITTKQSVDTTTDTINVLFGSARKAGVAYTFGRNQQDISFGQLTNTNIGLNYKSANGLTNIGAVVEHTEHPTMSDFQGLSLNVSHKVRFGVGELSVYGTQRFVFNNEPHSKDGSDGSSVGLNFHSDDAIGTTTLDARFVKSKVYSISTQQTTVRWRDYTTFSGTSLRKFSSHKIGLGGYYKFNNDINLADQIDGRLVWIFDQPKWQAVSELFLTKQKYKSDSYNLRDDENTLGLSVRYSRQISKGMSFHVDGVFSESSKSSRHPNPVDATEALSKTIAQNTVFSLGITHQF